MSKILETGIMVLMPVYNHGKYIDSAIAGVLMQKTKFPVELCISDDASTDNTHEACLKHKNTNNISITLEREKLNIGALQNGAKLRQYASKSNFKYIAICEGDDYWTDPLKLQKQVDFLETHDDFSICFHNVEERYQDSTKESFNYCKPNQKEETLLIDLLENSNYLPTCSIIFRNNLFEKIPSLFTDILMVDWIINILNAEHGKIKYFDKVMGVHRIHGGGIWSGESTLNNLFKVYNAYIKLGTYFQSNLTYKGIIENKKSQFLYLIHSEFYNIQNKKSAFKYFILFLFSAPFESFKITNIKRLVKLCIS